MSIRSSGDTSLAFRLACLFFAAALLSACGGGDGGTSAPTTDAPPPAAGGDPVSPDDPAPPATPTALDLSHWRLTIPADADSGSRGEALNIPPSALIGPPAYSSPWFYREADDALTFWVPVDGAIGGNSPNPRSELREMLDPDDTRVNWNAAQSSELNARCKVVAVPTANPQIIIGQIHAYNAAHPLVMLRYEYEPASGTGSLVAHVNTTPGGSSTLKFPLRDGLPMNQVFSYRLAVSQGVLTMSADGHSAQYTLGSQWRSAGLYFKAGAYIKAGGSGGGLVSFYTLQASHR